MSQNLQYEEPKTSKLQITTLGARIVTLACLVVSMVIIKTNTFKYKDGKPYTYKDVYTYRYAFFSMVVAFAYTVLQIPFAVYYAKTGKRLINHCYILEFDFYADKVNSLLLATGTGAAFGATMDLKHNNVDAYADSDLKSRYEGFFGKGYIAAGFLLIGFISAAVSSIISSLVLTRKG